MKLRACGLSSFGNEKGAILEFMQTLDKESKKPHSLGGTYSALAE